MTNNYRGGGNLVTRILGRLIVHHGAGIVEFEIRNESEIQKRGMNIILRIDGLGDIPRLFDGNVIQIDLRKDDNAENDPPRQEHSKGAA
jgi:hypothetical protein